MRGKFSAFCLVLSLLLCVGVCVMWVRSYWIIDDVEWKPAREDGYVVREYYLTSVAGTVVGGKELYRLASKYAPLSASSGSFEYRTLAADFTAVSNHEHYVSRKEKDGIRFLGFALLHRDYVGQLGQLESHRVAVVPYWSIVAATVLFPALRGLRRLRQRNRQKNTRCPTCGYDLRATPQRCPECGTAAVR